jgi:hypothetical protein
MRQIGVDLSTRSGAGFAQGFEEEFPVRIPVKNILAAIATIHDMVNGPFILDAQFARHRSARVSRKL